VHLKIITAKNKLKIKGLFDDILYYNHSSLFAIELITDKLTYRCLEIVIQLLYLANILYDNI